MGVAKPFLGVILLEHVRSAKPFLGWVMDKLNLFILALLGDNIDTICYSSYNFPENGTMKVLIVIIT